jgi:hypothetical protein
VALLDGWLVDHVQHANSMDGMNLDRKGQTACRSPAATAQEDDLQSVNCVVVDCGR